MIHGDAASMPPANASSILFSVDIQFTRSPDSSQDHQIAHQITRSQDQIASSPHHQINRYPYSVISGSNVHSASVTNTMSKNTRSAIQNCASPSSGVAWKSAAVPRTPAIMTGTVFGYNRIGSITSRLRARTSIAANSVPTTAKPVVPVSSSPASSSG